MPLHIQSILQLISNIARLSFLLFKKPDFPTTLVVPPTHLPMSVHHRTILYVDDDTDDQLFVLEALALLAPNAPVVVVGNGIETLAYLDDLDNEALPALIIMDINMPLLDGKETVIKIREQPRFNNIPIVLFTTSASLLDKQFGALYNIPFMTKPATSSELEQVMEQILQKEYALCNS